MKAATYNPDTLDRIRRGACAADLGWDESRYLSVCRRHGIEAMPSPSVVPTVPSPLPSALPAAARPKPAPQSLPRFVKRRKADVSATGRSIAVTPTMIRAVKDAANADGMTLTDFVRLAVKAEFEPITGLPRYSRTESLSQYLTPSFSVDEFARLDALALKFNVSFATVIRSAVAAALEKRKAVSK